MRPVKAVCALAFCAAALSAPAMAQSAPTPAGKFLQAADANNFAVMAAQMGRSVQTSVGATLSSPAFIRKLSNCYLRRIYAVDKGEAIMAAWMCDEGQGKSRVVVGKVADGDGVAQVTEVREVRNDRPAPPRTGSAFAERKA